jgi:hypothetical protein
MCSALIEIGVCYHDSAPGPRLEAIEAVPAGTVVGRQGHNVFFFISGKYVGTIGMTGARTSSSRSLPVWP